MKNTQKGVSTITAVIIGLIIILVIIGLAYFFSHPTPAADVQNDNPTATTTDTTATTTSTNVTTDPSNPNLKVYTNTTLGFSFSYPRDFVVLNEGFSTSTSAWSAVLNSGRGKIYVDVAKTFPTDGTTEQNQTVAMGQKQGASYVTRHDVCDVKVTRADLDSTYKIKFAFETCGDQPNAIFKSADEITALLNSVSFNNTNSQLYINTKLGEAFRYPITWTTPTSVTTSTNTKITFGNDLTIVASQNLSLDEAVANAMKIGSTTDQRITVGGKAAHLLTTTPVSGPKQRVFFITNTSPTDLVTISQQGVDSAGLDLVIQSFSFFK